VAPTPSIALLFRNAHLAIDAEVRATLAREGFAEILPGHAIVLRNLGEDGARPIELAAKAQVSRQAIAKVVDELEHLGLVRRDPDPDDGRGVIVRYTAHGLAGLAVARRRMRELEREFAREVGAEQWRAVRSALEALFGEQVSTVGPV
jgi:DNA-binding MarR family transcriptional regulator